MRGDAIGGEYGEEEEGGDIEQEAEDGGNLQRKRMWIKDRNAKDFRLPEYICSGGLDKAHGLYNSCDSCTTP